jgi:hypothetical protein
MAAGGTLLYQIRDPEPEQTRVEPRPDSEGPDGALSTLERRIRELERRTRRNSVELGRRAEAGTPRLEPPTIPSENEQGDSVDDAPHAGVSEEGSEAPDDKELFEDYYAEEVRDPDWAPTAVATVERLLQDQRFPGATARNVDCGTRMCRLEVAHESEPDAQAFNLDFPTTVGEDFGGGNIETTAAEDGTMHTVVYLVRRGVGYPHMWAEEDGYRQ